MYVILIFTLLDSLASCGTVSDTLIIPEMVDNVEVNRDGCKFRV